MRNCLAGITVVAVIVLASCGVPRQGSQVVSYDDLARQMTSAQMLDGVRNGIRHLHTSYDRSGGNNDHSYYLSEMPDGRYVIADLAGPGCIHRFWYTGIGSGRKFWFYFDDEETPRLEAATEDIAGGTYPFSKPLTQQLSGGTYSYLPIPFRKRLKVVTDTRKGEMAYYQFGYSVFPENTVVPEFRTDDPELLKAVEKICGAWNSSPIVPVSAREVWNGVAPAGGSVTAFEKYGEGIVRQLAVKIQTADGSSVTAANAVLRDLALKIFWDGKKYPSVNVPVGDFFCNAWRRRSFESLPIEYHDGSYVCNFPMPFRKGCRIVFENGGSADVSLVVSADTSTECSGNRRYLHANWRVTTPPQRPHVILQAEGRGTYAGCFLTVTGTDKSWMILEGDDQIYIDGEDAPSMHGTGLEDYFNGGWYYSGLFCRPFHGLLERTPFRTAQYRFHVPDPVDFRKGIRVQFEKGDRNTAGGYMTSVAYWYQDKPMAVDPLPEAGIRHCDIDSMETYSLMLNLIETERIGRYEEGLEICDEFIEKYPRTREAAVLQLRKLAYVEKLQGFDSVRDEYKQWAQNCPDRAIASCASNMLAYHSSTNLALLGVFAGADYDLYVDGDKIGNGSGPHDMQAFAVNMPPGRHVIAAKVSCGRPKPWFSVCLKSHYTNCITDASWRVSYDPGENWESVGYNDSAWEPALLWSAIPFLGQPYVAPNPFIYMQTPRHLISHGNWAKSGRAAYFRKTVIIPER